MPKNSVTMPERRVGRGVSSVAERYTTSFFVGLLMDTVLETVEPIFRDLSPAIVWRHFAVLCAIPRPSKKESRLARHLVDWAKTRGLSAELDGAGNLVVRKPASAGC